MHSNKTKAIIALLIVSAIWGIAGPVIKYTLGAIPPFTFLALRMLLATVVITPLIISNGGFTQLKKEGLVKLSALSLLGQTLTLSLIFLGYTKTSAIEGALIGAVFPVLLTFAGAIFLRDKVTSFEKAGITATALGAALIIFAEPLLAGNGVQIITNIEGNLLILAGNITWILYILLEKKRFASHKDKRYRFEGMGFSFIVAFLSFIPLALVEIYTLDSTHFLQLLPTPSSLIGIAYMGLLSSVVAYLLYDFGLSKVEASETGVFSYLQPLFALPAAYFILGELPSVYLLPGAVLILIGFYLSEKGS